MDSEHLDLNRRELIGSAAGMGLLILKPHVVRGSQANSAIRIGLLGCGARGTAVAKSFITNTTARYVALADIFPDQLNRAKNYFDRLAEAHSYSGIDPALVFRGPQSYQELASSEKIDVVHIATPGFFHVDHLETAVVAAKHVYCEKPLGIDVVQAKRAMEIGERAEGRLSLEVGFQIRSAPPFIELVRRIHKNAIGPVACISAHYHATAMTYPARSPMSHDELRLRNWYWDHILSGGILVDQNIHVFDICNWVLKNHPLKAMGTGGRNVRSDFGDIWDNYQVEFTYPEGVHVSFNSVQFGNKVWDVEARVFGGNGVSELSYSGPIRIIGDEPWVWQDPQVGNAAATGGLGGDNLVSADKEKDKAFIESIVSGKFHNQAAAGVESAFTSMLGRSAAHLGHEVTWDQLLNSNQQYELGINLSQFKS